MDASLADQPGGDGLEGCPGPGQELAQDQDQDQSPGRDQGPSRAAAPPWAGSLAIALGANLGDPVATLVAVRPLLAGLLATLLEEGPPVGALPGASPAGIGGPGCGGLPRSESAPLAQQALPPDPPSRTGAEPRPEAGPAPRAALGSEFGGRVRPIRLSWSPLFCTEPVGGPPGQPAYLNGVLLVEGVAGLEPRPLQLLQGLQALEAQFGRQRLEAWGPRTLDLDLLWWGDQRVQAAALELPHPRLRQRSFVLAPLAAIDPLLVPPGPAAGGTPSPTPGQDCGSLLAALLPRLLEAAPQRLPGRAGWPE